MGATSQRLAGVLVAALLLLVVSLRERSAIVRWAAIPQTHPFATIHPGASTGVISSFVKDQRGNPVASASVQVIVTHPAANGQPTRRTSTTVTTNAQGFWSIPLTAPFDLQAMAPAITIRHPLYAMLRPPRTELAGLGSGSLVLTLLDGLTVSGTIVDRAGRGVAGYRFYIGTDISKAATTDADGRFTVEHLLNGPAVVRGQDNTKGYITGDVTITPGMAPLQLTVVPGIKFTGSVHDAQGRAVAGARIILLGGNSNSVSGQTDAEGKFQLDNVNPASTVILVTPSGGNSTQQSIPPGQTSIDVKLPT